MNEAQFVALKISDPAVPTKTPLALSKFTSTGAVMIFYHILCRPKSVTPGKKAASSHAFWPPSYEAVLGLTN